MFQIKRNPQGFRRRGVVVVYTVVVLFVLVGFAALTLDLGAMYNERADLQDAADAAALAAAIALSETTGTDRVEQARQAAMKYVTENPAFSGRLAVDPNNDITFGRARWNDGVLTFTEDLDVPDSVRVRVALSEGSANGPMALYFARIFGMHSASVQAGATAMMTPRDMAIVVDVSGSTNFDSQLQHAELTEVNIYDVWDYLPGGFDDGVDSVWLASEVPADQGQAQGPAWGYFKNLGFGTYTVDPSYSPTADSGLVKLTYNQDWSNTQLRNYLSARGYTNSELNAIMSRSFDSSGSYDKRVAVALGLAVWKSGKSGGMASTHGFGSGGDGDNNVESSELVWNETIMGRTANQSRDIWLDYINNYVAKSNSSMNSADSNYRYRFGVKTFVDYLQANRRTNAQTPELAGTPAQPLQAIKDAVGYLVEEFDAIESYDQLSLEIFATSGRHERDLSTDFNSVMQRLTEIQAGHYDGSTNIGGGIQKALDELGSDRARSTARKVIVLLTDGVANIGSSGQNSESAGADYALDMAQAALDQGYTIFAISVGAGADLELMEQIAEIGHGEHFHASGTIEEYSAALGEIFIEIGGRRQVELIE